MNYLVSDREILSSVKGLNGTQKSDVLDYIKNLASGRHSTRVYRRRAMKQIREALKNA